VSELEQWYDVPVRSLIELAQELFGEGKGAKDALECAYYSDYWRMWDGGNQWSGWVAYISFFRYVAKLSIDYSKWEHYEKAAIHSGPRVMHREFCIVSDRPELLLVDEQNRPHSLTGPFCRWRDGTALYAVHGVRVPGWIIERPERITIKRIVEEGNAEIRRVMIEKIGAEKFLREAGAKRVQADDFGTLYRVEFEGDEPLQMVEVENSSPELDGSFKKYMIRVPPQITTAHEAVAWTWGLTRKHYAPAVET
jgi:hypothetical protein